MRRIVASKFRSRRTERGYLIALFAVCIAVLLGLAGVAIDVANWYLQIAKVQHAADAAALDGAVYLPSDPDGGVAVSHSSLQRNVKDSHTLNTANAFPLPSNPSRMRVILQARVKTQFLQFIGAPEYFTFSRMSTATWRGPLDAGRWSNVLGKEAPIGPLWAPAEKSAISGQYWVQTTGGEEPKIDGYRYTSFRCESGVAGCAGSTNLDYIDDGDPSWSGPQTYNIVAPPGLSGNTVAIEIYDAPFGATGNECEAPKSDQLRELFSLTGSPNFNPDNMAFCSGDIDQAGNSAAVTDTKIQVLNQDNSVAATCPSSLLFKGYGAQGAPSLTNAYNTDPLFHAAFRNWYRLCTLPYDAINGSNYKVVVRSEKHKQGVNGFSVRAGLFSGGVLRPDSEQRQITVHADSNIQVHVNTRESIAQVPVAKVPQSYAGSTLRIQAFDFGDAVQPGVLSLISDAISISSGGSPTTQCQMAITPSSTFTDMPNCTRGNVHVNTGYQGQIVDIQWKVPSDYTCDESGKTVGQSCTLFVKMTYAAGSGVYDNWTASVSSVGAPVRLVRDD